MSTSRGSLNRVYDAGTLLKDAGLVAASAAMTVAAAASIIDLANGGSVGFKLTGDDAVPYVEGDLVVDITAIETATGDELYTILLEGCNTADFTSGSPQIEPLCAIIVGAGAVIPGAGATTSVVGRYVVPWCNRRKADLHFRYVRGFTVVAGTIATGINFTARLSKRVNSYV